MAVLQILLEHSGEVVSREELQRRLWPSDTFVDFEHGLNTAVKELRGVLGDSATEPRYIETLPRVGYRMLVAAEEVTKEKEKGGWEEIRTAALEQGAVESSSVRQVGCADCGDCRGASTFHV